MRIFVAPPPPLPPRVSLLRGLAPLRESSSTLREPSITLPATNPHPNQNTNHPRGLNLIPPPRQSRITARLSFWNAWINKWPAASSGANQPQASNRAGEAAGPHGRVVTRTPLLDADANWSGKEDNMIDDYKLHLEQDRVSG